MPKKVALLIGVSQYEVGLPPLPAAPNDVEAMRRVLQDPNLSNFDGVETLINPDPTAMRVAIEQLFTDCQKEDLVLLFFSGHGITDDNGRLYLTTRITDERTFKATSVPASFLHEVMNDSRCQRQVVILDCCYSGAFIEGWQPKSGGTVDIKQQLALGGKGRAVLTSSSSLQKSFEHEGSGIYTRYLVEGLETGAADRDGSGTIALQELHEYAKEKVQAAKPAMMPQFYPHQEGFNIVLAQSLNNPELKYRREVENWVGLGNGEISEVGRRALKLLRDELGISHEVAETIEASVLEPYEKHKRNLREYEEALIEALKPGYPLSEATYNQLKYFQEFLGLTDKDVAPIETRIVSDRVSSSIGQYSEPNPKSVPPTDDLPSERGVDYKKLRDLLAAGEWKEADQETLAVMLKAAGRETENYLNIESIENFPRRDLRTIDQLWVTYSNKRFGFSVQQQLYAQVNQRWENFSELVGWQREANLGAGIYGLGSIFGWKLYEQLTFTLDAPKGHFPVMWNVWGVWINGGKSKAARLTKGWRSFGMGWGFWGGELEFSSLTSKLREVNK